MGDNAELHAKIHQFLLIEWARQDNRQLVEVELFFAPGGGFREEPVRKWVRTDEPDFFAEVINVEKLVVAIIDIAENETEAKPAGKYRFVVRTKQHLGERPYMSFSLSPRYIGGGDETSLVPGSSGGGVGSRGNDVAVAQLLVSNNGQLMRINTQMFDGTIRVLGQQNLNMHEQIMALTAENATLRRELEEARSNKMDREFQIAMAAEKNARTNAGFAKVLQIGTVLASKIGAGSDAAQLGAASPLSILIGEFYQSLRQEQLGVLMQTLDMGQKIMFMEIVNVVRPPDKGPGGPQQGSPPAGGPNGARP